MDQGGYVQVVGRIKDIIIRSGENIYPREVEEFLLTHPEVKDIQVFGVSDKKYGEQVCAWIVLSEGSVLTEDEIKLHCRARISYFKIPFYIRFVTEFPMTVTGKIQKFKMRQTTEAELSRAIPKKFSKDE